MGSIRRFGLDLGASTGGVMVRTMVSSSSGVRVGALAGDYVGGSDDQEALQPLSLQGQVGTNITAGVAQISLRPAVVR